MTKTKKAFKPVSAKVSFPELEEKILKFWKKNKIFKKSVNQRPKDNSFTFYDGPPFITGLPHYGHLLGSVAKDLIPRYQTMKGKRVRRVWGWDCHGLPVEEKTERKLGLENRRDIEKIGVDRFIKECRNYVSETSAEWVWYIDHIARWVDMENAYKTMDLAYMESVIWAFKKLYDQGLIYQGLKTLLYCTRCGTPVSKFEIAMDDSYAKMQDPAVTVEFPISGKTEFKGSRILAWTTTPWTLPSNRALVVGPEEDYFEFELEGKKYIIAKKRTEAVLGDKKFKKLREFKGDKLLGLDYQPIYKYIPPNKKDFKIYQYPEMVNMEEGTGIVHSAPGFGEIDTRMGKHYGLTLMFTVDDEGKFTDKIKDFAGIYVKKADPLIIKDLEKKEKLFKKETIVHRYPYCYRCETPLIHRAVKAWFVDVKKIKDRMLKLNKKVHWVPEFLKSGRVKNTMKEAPDWCISRTRYWATVMPVWRCEACQELKVVGSITEIEKNSIQKVKVTNLHRTGVDNISFKCQKCGGLMHRIPEVVDVWFESGSMPFAQFHYPFENKEVFDRSFPGDYIVEYIAQIRAWFYYLHVLSTILFDSHCFKNVVTTGVMAGTDGRKMSKTYGNYPDPKGVLKKYGGDALRLYLMGSPLMMAGDINITQGEELLEQVKTVLLPIWNSHRFFVTYANLTGYKPCQKDLDFNKPSHILNQWIAIRVQEFVNQVDELLKTYHIPDSVRLIRPFIDDFSTWYIRRSRSNFSQNDKEFYKTFYSTFLKFLKASAPVIPFIAENLYQRMYSEILSEVGESIHLEYFPKVKKLSANDEKLIKQMGIVRQICSLAHSIRKKEEIRVRQPLAELTYYWPIKISPALEKLIIDEVNVKKIVWRTKQVKEPKVKLDTKLNSKLKSEGMARDLVRKIQRLRKKKQCRLNEEIIVYLPKSVEEKLTGRLLEYIEQKTLALKIDFADQLRIEKKD